MDPVKVVVSSSGIMPERKSEWASGYDLCACLQAESQYINPMSWRLIATGIKLEIPNGWEAQIRPRSSMTMAGIILPIGTIDSDYRGEIKIMAYNTGSSPFKIVHGQRIAQLVFSAVCQPRLVKVEELSNSERGEGGFGSTGR